MGDDARRDAGGGNPALPESRRISGSGNDFVIVEDPHGRWGGEAGRLARELCAPGRAGGADGLLLMRPAGSGVVELDYRNADGSSAELCANGARCAAWYAARQGITGAALVVRTGAGDLRATVEGERVRMAMPDPRHIRLLRSLVVGDLRFAVHLVDTGCPHLVFYEDREGDVDFARVAPELRAHPDLDAAGVNVDLVSPMREPTGGGGPDETRLRARFWERGVEGETGACGTGAVAVAVVSALLHEVPSPVHVECPSGELLTVRYRRRGVRIGGLSLEGGVRWLGESR